MDDSIKKALREEWAMQADLRTLVGGVEWERRRWSTDTLWFYNREAFDAWLKRYLGL